jgi:hypothetical protein
MKYLSAVGKVAVACAIILFYLHIVKIVVSTFTLRQKISPSANLIPLLSPKSE